MPYDGPVDDNFKVVRKKEKKDKKEQSGVRNQVELVVKKLQIQFRLHEVKAAAYPNMWYGMPPGVMDPHAAERQMQEIFCILSWKCRCRGILRGRFVFSSRYSQLSQSALTGVCSLAAGGG